MRYGWQQNDTQVLAFAKKFGVWALTAILVIALSFPVAPAWAEGDGSSAPTQTSQPAGDQTQGVGSDAGDSSSGTDGSSGSGSASSSDSSGTASGSASGSGTASGINASDGSANDTTAGGSSDSANNGASSGSDAGTNDSGTSTEGATGQDGDGSETGTTTGDDPTVDPADPGTVDPEPKPEKQLATPYLTSLKFDGSALVLRWNAVDNAAGYLIYRKPAASSKARYQVIGLVTKAGTHYFADSKAPLGTAYAYRIKAVPAEQAEAARNELIAAKLKAPAFAPEVDPEAEFAYTTSSLSNYRTGVRLKTPSVSIKTKKTSKKKVKLTITWKRVTGSEGYQVQYSTNRLFLGAKTYVIKKGYITKKVVKKLSKKKKYYVRVRAYKTVSKVRWFSEWGYSSNCKGTSTVVLTAMKAGTKIFELRSSAGQTSDGYGTLEGSCVIGNYGYFALLNQKNDLTKLVKVNLLSMKVVKVSEPLDLGHANGMTYNSKTKRIIVSDTDTAARIHIVDPATLTRESTLKMSKSLDNVQGANENHLSSVKGVSSIAYDSAHNLYYCGYAGSGNILVVDSNFVPQRYINVSTKGAGRRQDIVVVGDFVLRSFAQKSGVSEYNYLYVYSRAGKYLGRLRTSKAKEIEGAFVRGKTLYVPYHWGRYETRTVNGKKQKTWVRTSYIFKVSFK